MCPNAMLAGVLVLCLATGAFAAQPEPSPMVEPYLHSGRLSDGRRDLEQRLAQRPDDDETRFGLGMLQFLQAVEHLSQNLYRHGALTQPWTRNLPLLRAAVPGGQNPNPQPIAYEDLRLIVQSFQKELLDVEKTLATIKSPAVKLPIHFGLIRLDFNGDGQATDQETLWQLYSQMNRAARADAGTAKSFVIAFDLSDVHWLRGYCHLLAAMTDIALAYDGSELFDVAGHVLFANTRTSHTWLRENRKLVDLGQGVDIADVIAFIHMIRLPVKEPRHMESALKHLQAMLEQSRHSWNLILAESDDDQEWIPSPRQKGVIPNVAVTEQMVAAWREFLDEADALLAGKRLVPFWRSKELGVNLHKVFAEPRTFDLVLWIQGTAATPCLEKGEFTRPEVWNRLMQVFQGEFIGFALWFN